MPYNISAAMLKKLPAKEQGTVESVGQQLYDHQGGLCWLCSGSMSVAAEVLQADHDVPEKEGGQTEIANLHLAHTECNKSKRNLSTAQVRPYLQLRRFIRDSGGRVKYDGVLDHFDINPMATKIDVSEASVTIEFGDGVAESYPVFREEVDGHEVEFCFVEVPRLALFNDAEVQPRNIRYDHAFSIYQDLLRNPLHEPPGCRLSGKDASGLQKILMFDGQHKTIATWMLGRTHVVVKLYLDLNVAAANFLVNSIQSKIKKLPLSAFEVAAKMSDEWQNKVDKYESEMAEIGKAGSEAGFIDWVPAGAERNRAKQAFKAALAQRVLDHTNFHLRDFVDSKSTGSSFGLTESMVKSKVIDQMLSDKTLDVPFYDSTNRREEEVENIVWMWNVVVDQLATNPSGSEPPAEVLVEARRRLFKQESLQHVSLLLGQFYRHTMMKGDDPMLDGVPTGADRDKIELGIKHICSHPVWTADLDRDAKMLAVRDVLSKNQGGRAAFEDVALKLTYMGFGRDDSSFASYWLEDATK